MSQAGALVNATSAQFAVCKHRPWINSWIYLVEKWKFVVVLQAPRGLEAAESPSRL
jgi:hypothetical protein